MTMKYYIYNINTETRASRDIKTLKLAKKILCMIAGINIHDFNLYMQSNLCEYEIRTTGGDDE